MTNMPRTAGTALYCLPPHSSRTLQLPTTPSDHDRAIRSVIPNLLTCIVARIARTPHNARGAADQRLPVYVCAAIEQLTNCTFATRKPSLRYSASFFANSWLMIFGLPWPRISFMHWPTKNPMTFVLPSL